MDLESFRTQVAGVAAVSITPFDEHGALDEAALRRVVRHMDEGGVDTIVAGGGTGEYYALTPEERIQVGRVAIDEATRAPVVVSVGLGPIEAADAARTAERDGAAGIMIHPPIHPYTHPDGLLAYFRTICEAVSIGVILYVRDPATPTDLLARMIALPNVVAVKYAVNDVRRFGTIVEQLAEVADVAWLCGTAEAWAPFYWLAGATGFTSGLANFAPGEAAGLRDALRDADVDEVRRRWQRLRPVEDLRSRHRDANNIAVLKAGTELCGLGGGPLRPPLRPLPDHERDELAAILTSWGVPVLSAAGAGRDA